ncbi:MAG: hypothetical protein ACRDRL_22515 [Sciscionella sp.]
MQLNAHPAELLVRRATHPIQAGQVPVVAVVAERDDRVLYLSERITPGARGLLAGRMRCQGRAPVSRGATR